MSIRNTFLILNLITISFSFSQERQADTVILFLNFKSKTITHFISKDTTYISFGIYRKGFDTKKKREDTLKSYSYKGRRRVKTFEDLKKANPKKMPKSDMLPTFSLNYWSIKKPDYLNSISDIRYITEDEFRANELNYLFKKTYMIHKLDTGMYLKWEVELVPKE